MYRTGDILLKVESSTFLGKLIKKLTFSNVSHAAIIYDEETVFEMDSSLKATMKPTSKLNPKDFVAFRPKLTASERSELMIVCVRLEGKPYSIWDLCTNAMTFWLNSNLRRKLVTLLGNKTFMVCSELVSRVLNTVDPKKFKCLADYESIRPDDLMQICRDNPSLFREVTNEIRV